MDKDRKYLHTIAAGVVVPFLQAVATGFIFGLLALVLAFAFHWRGPWAWSGVVFVLVLAFTWLQLQRRWHELTSLKLSQDATVLPPRSGPPDGLLVRLAAEVDGTYQETRATLPATLAQMQDLAAGLMAGEPFTERAWSGYGKPFSLNGFRELRSEMIKRGLLVIANPKDPRQGYILTCVGRQAMRAFVPDIPSPIQPSDLVKL